MNMRIDCGEYELLNFKRHLTDFEPLQFVDEDNLNKLINTLEHLIIGDDSLNGDITQLSFVSLHRLKTINIGANCCQDVTKFELKQLQVLESVFIDTESFTPDPIWEDDGIKYYMQGQEIEYGSFSCCDCPSLTSLVISSDAFKFYSEFTLSREYKIIE